MLFPSLFKLEKSTSFLEPLSTRRADTEPVLALLSSHQDHSGNPTPLRKQAGCSHPQAWSAKTCLLEYSTGLQMLFPWKQTCRTNPLLHKLQKNQTPPSPPQIPESDLDLDTQAGGDVSSSHCQWPMQVKVWLSEQMTSAPQFQFCNQKEPGFSSDFSQ